MAKIILSEPNGLFQTTIDTEIMQVEIEEAFLGVSLVTKEGEKLSVSMRDGGFEVRYTGLHYDNVGKFQDSFNAGWTDFKNGQVTRRA